MTMREVHLWAAYRRKNGPMNDARRYDAPAARIAAAISRAAGIKAVTDDFMPVWQENEERGAVNIEEEIAAFGG